MIDISWWKKKIGNYNLIFFLSGVLFLLILWLFMCVNKNFINIFFFLPAIAAYSIFVNIFYFLVPYIAPFFLKKLGKIYSTKSIYRYYTVLTISMNFALMILVILEFKLYEKSHLHWP